MSRNIEPMCKLIAIAGRDHARAALAVRARALASAIAVVACVWLPSASAAEPMAGKPTAGDSTAAGADAGELRVRLDEDVITGSTERPKVLYILPWRSAQGTAGLDAAPDLKASELFESLDPDAHGRQLRYRQRLGGDGPDATR